MISNDAEWRLPHCSIGGLMDYLCWLLHTSYYHILLGPYQSKYGQDWHLVTRCFANEESQ